MAEQYDVMILGGGPAGLTAGIYLGRNRLKTLIIDSGVVGGQMVLSHEVANYPGVVTASGRDISQTMLRQARSFGAEVISQATVTRMELDGEMKVLEVEDEGIFQAPAIILAPGGTPRMLGLESEKRLKGKGISYCATCDGDFFTNKPIVVVGGGNSALEEAVSLTKYASRVTVLHVLPEFQAQPWAVAEAEQNEKVELYTEHRVIQFAGEESLEAVVTEDLRTGERRTVSADGCFVFIGYEPNTESLRGLVDMNERNEVITDEGMGTRILGVFVAGDARVKRYRQITTAVADGTIAALSVSDYLVERARRTERLAA